MLSMAYCNPSDMDFLDTVSMDSHDIQSEMEKILANADFLNSENSNHANSAFDFDTTGPNSIDDWIQNIQWNEVAKVHNVMDSSFEIDNNNPNLIVNPQSVMPIAVTPARHSSPKKTAFSQIGTQTKPNSTAVNVQGSVYGSEALGLKIENVVSLNPQYIEKNNNNLSSAINSSVQGTAVSIQSPSRVSKPVTVSLSNSAVSTIDFMEEQEKVYPKPVYSYSCLIAMALKNSRKGSLPVSEIYSFMTEHFPYFKTAPDGWKNSVRHNLSLNKCFEKVDSPKMNGNTKKGCLWALNPAKILKMEDEIAKHRKKDLDSILKSMSNPDKLELIEAGKAGPPGSPKEDTPSPTQPIREEKNFLPADVGILENGIGLEQGLPDISFPSSGIWDEIRIDSVTSPSTTQVLTISAAPLSGPTTIATGNSNIYGILTCSSPMNPQNSRVSQSS